jgi:RND family efflux transporter, MFP subunit
MPTSAWSRAPWATSPARASRAHRTSSTSPSRSRPPPETAATKGHLQLVDNQVDARTGTVRVRAVFQNADGNLMPGQFARVRLGRAKAQPAVLISERAVGTDQSKRFVMVVGADNKVSWREVSLGAEADGLRIVTRGLVPGERIVVDGLQRVRPGMLVAPQPQAMKVAAAAQGSAE